MVPAKLAAATVIDLLWDDAKLAKQIKQDFKPAFANKEEYLEYAAGLFDET